MLMVPAVPVIDAAEDASEPPVTAAFPVMFSCPFSATVVELAIEVLLVVKVAAALVMLKMPAPTVIVSPLLTPPAPFTVMRPPAAVIETVDVVASVELTFRVPPMMTPLPTALAPVTLRSASRVLLVTPPVSVTLPSTVIRPVVTVACARLLLTVPALRARLPLMVAVPVVTVN